MMALLKRMRKSIKDVIKKINSSLVYRLAKKEIECSKLKKEIDQINYSNLIKERKYIDELNIKKNEIRYIDLQMARVTKYINSNRFFNDNDEEKRLHLIDLIKGNKLE